MQLTACWVREPDRPFLFCSLLSVKKGTKHENLLAKRTNQVHIRGLLWYFLSDPLDHICVTDPTGRSGSAYSRLIRQPATAGGADGPMNHADDTWFCSAADPGARHLFRLLRTSVGRPQVGLHVTTFSMDRVRRLCKKEDRNGWRRGGSKNEERRQE